MKTRIEVLIVLLIVFVAGGILAGLVGRVRYEAGRMQCKNHLRQIGLAVDTHHDSQKMFPTGTMANPDLPPEKRFSWLVPLWPYYEANPRLKLDWDKAWDDPVNCPPHVMGLVEDGVASDGKDRYLVGKVHFLLCPANPFELDPAQPCPTHYVGIAGVGKDAAELPLLDPKAGFFGYDRKLTREDLKRGAATTLMLAEAPDGRPWTAGGKATVRGLAANKLPYIGYDGQFASKHLAGSNFVFADGSVRFLSASVSNEVLEAMAALAGRGDIIRFDD